MVLTLVVIALPNEFIITPSIFLFDLCIILNSALIFVAVKELNRFDIYPGLLFFVGNVIVIYLMTKITFLFTRHIIVTLAVADVFFFVWVEINYYVTVFRGSALLPWDLKVAGTAVDVLGGYTFAFYKEQYKWLLILFLFLCVTVKLNQKKIAYKEDLKYIAISILLCFLASIILVSSPMYKDLNDNMYKPQDTYAEEGMVLSFIHFIKFMRTPYPEGYSVDKVKELTNNNKNLVKTEGVVPQNIIVIMNESFADFSKIGSLDEIDESLEYYNSLDKNVNKGYLCVPVYGGSTVNTEYEFLTGNSIAFLAGGMPMVSSLNDNRPSVADYLGLTHDYEVWGFHPASGANYNRKNAYGYLGINNTVFLDDLDESKTTKFFHTVSDECDYSEVIELYENKTSDDFFCFNVTIQNHGGYSDRTDLNGKNVMSLSSYGDFPKAEVYLTCLKESDNALKDLIEYFDEVDENTMIAFFGDHLPAVEDEFLSYLYGASVDNMSKEQRLYQYMTPFVIWTNYDRSVDAEEIMSTNYFAEYILEVANIELPPYYNFLRNLRKKYPIISINGVVDNNGNYYEIEDVLDDKDIMDYRYFEYNNAADNDIYWMAYCNR